MFEISTGRTANAVKVVIYGVEGIGKSTLASHFPDPVFIDTEGSTDHMENVKRFPRPTSWSMLLEEVKQVLSGPIQCQTLVIDTIDWAERMATEHIVKSNGKNGIEDFGYGNGYTYVKEALGKLLDMLSEVAEHGINVVLTAHTAIRTFTNPEEMGEYDRYELKLINTPKVKNTEMVKEWSDLLLFCNFKSTIVSSGEGAKKKNYLTGGTERVMYSQRTAAFDAKSRFDLPAEMPLSFEPLAKLFEKPKTESEFKELPDEKLMAHKDDYVHGPMFKSEELVNPDYSQPVDLYDADEQVFKDIGLSEDDLYIIDHLPKALGDLMKANAVTPDDISNAVAEKGYFPKGMDIRKYPEDFINGVLVGAWPQVYELIKKNRNLPF